MARVEKSTFKVISGDEATADFRPWELPEVEASAARAASPDEGAGLLLTAGRIEEIQRQAHGEAFELGRREGLEHGRAEAQAEVERLRGILRLLAAPLAELDDAVVEELGRLSVTIARHVIRREVRTDPRQILGVVRQAAEALPVATRRVRLFLHPDDAAIVRESMSSATEQGGGWELVEDPAIGRGGCRVETESSRIDATIEKRIAAIAAELLGGEREGDDDRGGD